MDHMHIIPAFLARLSQIAREKSFRIDKAFVDWYLRTKFDPRCCKIHLTDGSSDGEIDGIVEEGEVVYIVQSKFSENVLKEKNATPLSMGDYAKFDKTVSSFENKGNFEEYLNTVELSLHSLYKKVFERYQKNPDLVVWEITTLHKSSPTGEKRVHNREKKNYFIPIG